MLTVFKPGTGCSYSLAIGAVLLLVGRLAAEEYAIGADVSFLRDAEAKGIVFKENGHKKPGLKILRDNGYNWVRLRLFHSPGRLPNDLDYTIALAKETHKLGFKILLNFHYSDTWADPQKQFIPKAWEGLSHEKLVSAVERYTAETITEFREAGVMPQMVQIGNEVIGGMLWPDGRLPDRWPQFAELVKAGIRGVDAGRRDASRPLIMIHIDRGGDVPATRHFFDQCAKFEIDFDVIGQSYYPWWHGTLGDLRENLAFMADRYGKDIVLVEVAYNWRTAEYRDNNGPFPETPEGQRQFLIEVDRIVRETPRGLGKGVFWWEPAVAPSPIASRGMFDRSGNALPVVSVFNEPAHSTKDQAGGR